MPTFWQGCHLWKQMNLKEWACKVGPLVGTDPGAMWDLVQLVNWYYWHSIWTGTIWDLKFVFWLGSLGNGTCAIGIRPCEVVLGLRTLGIGRLVFWWWSELSRPWSPAAGFISISEPLDSMDSLYKATSSQQGCTIGHWVWLQRVSIISSTEKYAIFANCNENTIE